MNRHLSSPQIAVFLALELPKIPKIFSARAFGARGALSIFWWGRRAENTRFLSAQFQLNAPLHTFSPLHAKHPFSEHLLSIECTLGHIFVALDGERTMQALLSRKTALWKVSVHTSADHRSA